MKVYEIAHDAKEEYLELSGFHVGTEYEIEDVQHISIDGETPGFSLVEDTQWWKGFGWMKDGSLRNNGIEVITPALTFEESLTAFNAIHKAVKVGNEAYTARTSIHVHVNVLPWSLDRLKTFTLLYALLEPAFFNYVGDSRKHNIHCVPLNYTIMPQKYSADISVLLSGWSKYTAFNLLPVKSYGTVEFRHMYGTGDIYLYSKWLVMIKNLWEFVNNLPEGSTFIYEYLSSGKSVKDLAGKVLQYSPDVDYSISTIDVKLAYL